MRMLPLECRMGLLLACGEGVSAAWLTGTFIAMRQREGKTQRQVPTNPPALPASSVFSASSNCTRAARMRSCLHIGTGGCGALRHVPSPRRCRGAPVCACSSVPPSLTSARTTSSLNKCSR
ncbi:hypothetical protein B0H10DRAFT_1977305 [Mycena sp. CBHHK59/15]|nr:hypothetical protein B0H10DRAFT_1977305 [Mycena sp. CBHHK59/15]